MSPQSADESSNTPKHDTVPKPSRSMPQIASKSGSRAPLAQSLPAGGVGDRDRAANGPLRSPIHSGCSGSGGKGLVDGPEPPRTGTAPKGRRERFSSSSSPSRTRRISWRTRASPRAPSAAGPPGGGTPGGALPPASSRSRACRRLSRAPTGGRLFGKDLCEFPAARAAELGRAGVGIG